MNSLLSNPEYGLVLLTPTEMRLYIGDNVQLELIEAREIEPSAPAMRMFAGLQNVISYRSQTGLKSFALHLLHLPRLSRMPVVVSGDPQLVASFARVFPHPHGVIQHPSADMMTMTCPEILASAWQFRASVVEIHVGHFQERLKVLMRQGRVSIEHDVITKAVHAGDVVRLLLPEVPVKATLVSEMAELVINDGGKVQIVPLMLLPSGATMLAVLRGESHAHTPLLALDA